MRSKHGNGGPGLLQNNALEGSLVLVCAGDDVYSGDHSIGRAAASLVCYNPGGIVIIRA